MSEAELQSLFNELNLHHFEGVLPRLEIRWNPRLRSSAGRFLPGARRLGLWIRQPVIELASYLLEEAQAQALIRDTLGHELIHYWLWVRRKPYGHTPEFWRKMREMGVSRWNPVPRTRPPKYVYECPACHEEFPARRRLGVLACARCCRRFAQGKFDAKYRLQLKTGGGPEA